MKIRILTFLTLMFVLVPFSNADGDLGYQGKNNDGLSPEDLLSQLKSDGETLIRMERDWTVATSNKLRVIWSFPPEQHPAYPSFVKREVIEKDGSVYMETSVRCGAEKIECDKLVKDFIELNSHIKNAVNSK